MGTNVVEGCCDVGTKPVSPHPLTLNFSLAFTQWLSMACVCTSSSVGLDHTTRCGWIGEVLAVVHSSVCIVVVLAQLTVRSPLIAVDDRSGQHDMLDDGEQRHHSMVLYELHVADSRRF